MTEMNLNFPTRKQVKINLTPFTVKETTDYILLDTGCVLLFLRRFPSLVHRIETNQLKLAVIKHTINEVYEHLSKSLQSKIKANTPTGDILKGFSNFSKFLEHPKIKKFENPKVRIPAEISKKYGEDSLLVCVLTKGHFNSIATQDGPLHKKLSDDKKITCQQLLS